MFQTNSHQTDAFQDGPGPAVTTLGWDIPSFQPPSMSTVVRRRYAGTKGKSGFAFFNFVPYGWEVPPFQPRHPRRELAGAIMPSDQGIYSVYVPPVIIPTGWDIAPFQPPTSPWPISRDGAIMAGDQGIEAQFINFIPYVQC